MKYDLLRDFRDAVESQKIEEFAVESAIDPIRSHLNQYFYNTKHIDYKSCIYGSFLRGTAIAEFGEINLLYLLPDDLHAHMSIGNLDAHIWMVELLNQIFSGTPWTVNFDGVTKSFLIQNVKPWPIRLKPAFYLNEERYATLESINSAYGAILKPFVAEQRFRTINFNSNRTLEILSKTTRYWVKANRVPLGGFLIDCLAMSFVQTSPYSKMSKHYQDCLLRDFFRFLSKFEPQQDSWTIEGTDEQVYRTGIFEPAAEKAYHTAERMIANSTIRQDEEAKLALRHLIGKPMVASF